MKTKLFTLSLAIVAGIGTMHAAIVNGTCGDNLTWSLNTKDSTLTIEGSGAMTSAPWYEYRSYIYTVNLPNGLTSIGGNAFRQCSNLFSIIIPTSVTSIGGGAFRDCTSLTSIDIPDSVTSIGSQAFYQSGLTSVTIGDRVTNIPYFCFYGCRLTSVTIPNSVTYIDSYAFDMCPLTSVAMGNGITWIGNRAFQYCRYLTSIKIPDSVKIIVEEAFQYCSSLTTIEIGNGIETIGNNAFKDCPVAHLTITATTPPSASSSNIPNASCRLFVPEEARDTYANTVWWEDFMTIKAIGEAIESYRVEFHDFDGTILKIDSVEYNSAAVAPANPSREGYQFIGWNKDFSHVTSDMTITAQYAINYYPVGFLNYDGTLLSEQSIAYNQAAMEPEVPAREGYTFIGWTADITHITARTFAIALYEKQNLLLVTYKKEDGEVISSENVDLHLPEAPEIEGFSFLGWRPVATLIESNTIVIEAVYESEGGTDLPAEVSVLSTPAQKLIRNGNVYVLTSDKTYTITGAEVK